MRPASLALSGARAALARARTASKSSTQLATAARTFSSLPSLRPTLPAPRSSAFRPATLPLSPYTPTGITTSSEVVADIVPRGAVSTHPALAGAQQVRCGPRPTMERSSRLIRKRRHGFLARLRTRNGRKTLQRRKDKGRHRLSA
ncbi:hypothetical protein F4780DRAFT_764343 [Xylariomycetidae sp. FL0641]|nr:hypothetical protein F4780DRAFT_764343 [Xylariomycetidae sp. FL0641]